MSQQQQQQQTAEDAASLKRQLAKGNENLNKKNIVFHKILHKIKLKQLNNIN